MNYAERIDELERRHRDSVALHEAQQARARAIEAAMQSALTMYIDTITAPWRALVEDLRR